MKIFPIHSRWLTPGLYHPFTVFCLITGVLQCGDTTSVNWNVRVYVETKLQNVIGYSFYHLQKGKPRNWILPVSVDFTIPGLLLHIEKCTDLHNAGETGIQKYWEQQWGREELSCWSVWSQLWVSMSWTHWKKNTFFHYNFIAENKHWDAYNLESCIRVQI